MGLEAFHSLRVTETAQLLNARKYITTCMTEATGCPFSTLKYLPTALKLTCACISAALGPPVLVLLGLILPNLPASIRNAQLLKSMFAHSDLAFMAVQGACVPFELFLHVYSVISALLGGCMFIVCIGTLTAYGGDEVALIGNFISLNLN